MKPGDRVICVDPGDLPLLRKGARYTIERTHIDGQYVDLSELSGCGSYRTTRFQPDNVTPFPQAPG
jgi:hypothetical protein